MNRPTSRYSTNSYSALANTLYFSVVLLLGAWLIWDATAFRLATYVPWAEYWEYAAVLNEWLWRFSSPANPHVVDPSLSSSFNPLYWVLTLTGRSFGLDAIQLMGIAGVLNFVLIVAGLKLFLAKYFRDPWAPLVGFIVIFMFWGISWSSTGLFQLRNFFYIAGYPSTFAFGLSLISFWLTIRLLHSELSGALATVCLSLLAALMLLCDPTTAVFAFAGCALLASTESTGSGNLRAAVLLGLLAGAILALLWPYFSVWKMLLGLLSTGGESLSSLDQFDPVSRFEAGEWQHPFYQPRVIISSLGVALIGLPIAACLFLRREYAFIFAGVVLMAVPYLLNMFVEIPHAYRFILFAAFYLQLAIVWGWLRIIDSWKTIPQPRGAGVLLALSIFAGFSVTAFNSWMLTLEFRGLSFSPLSFEAVERRTAIPGSSVTDLYRQLTLDLPRSAVVLTTAELGWPLPAIRGKVVSLLNENSLLRDQAKRYKATGDFFYRPVGRASRVEIAQRYNATHVLTSDFDSGTSAEIADWLALYAIEITKVGGYHMYQLTPAFFMGKLEQPVAAPAHAPKADSPAKVESAAKPKRVSPPSISPANDEPAEAESGSATRSFGAPIAEPVLDPERHGG